MKAGKEHRVPLSAEALALLDALPRMAGTICCSRPRAAACSPT